MNLWGDKLNNHRLILVKNGNFNLRTKAKLMNKLF